MSSTEAAPSSETNGEARLRAFEELLEQGYEFNSSEAQREFHALCAQEIAANIVGPEEWAKIGERLRRARD